MHKWENGFPPLCRALETTAARWPVTAAASIDRNHAKDSDRRDAKHTAKRRASKRAARQYFCRSSRVARVARAGAMRDSPHPLRGFWPSTRGEVASFESWRCRPRSALLPGRGRRFFGEATMAAEVLMVAAVLGVLAMPIHNVSRP